MTDNFVNAMCQMSARSVDGFYTGIFLGNYSRSSQKQRARERLRFQKCEFAATRQMAWRASLNSDAGTT